MHEEKSIKAKTLNSVLSYYQKRKGKTRKKPLKIEMLQDFKLTINFSFRENNSRLV